MKATHDFIKGEFQEYLWRALQVFNIYRLVLTTSLIVFYQFGISPKQLGSGNAELYEWVIALYFIFALIVIGLLFLRKPEYKASVVVQLTLDIVAITVIIYASGGLNTGLGVLLAVSVAVSSLLIGSRKAAAVPAAATLALFGQAFYAYFSNKTAIEFTSISFLGASFFIISFLSLALAKRLYYSERAALESQADLATMQAVNQDIIQTLNSGVLVVNEDLVVQMMNDSAWRILGMPESVDMQSLSDVNHDIFLATEQWLSQSYTQPILIKIQANSTELQLSFKKLGTKNHNLILIFLDDTSKLTQQAQQMKLSSLGRLTASIAHEIRNPLGAISHAAQLLNESEEIDTDDKDLCQVIMRHSTRMNSIIENVLNLSQRRPPQQEEIDLGALIELVVNDICQHYTSKPIVTVELEPNPIRVRFDRSQLIQVVNNLSENGLRYSEQETGEPSLMIHGGLEYPSGSVYLDIIDNGPGIDSEAQDKIFEPFFTTSSRGTGLGLYLARELCESNGARISYVPAASGGSCFRIQFA